MASHQVTIPNREKPGALPSVLHHPEEVGRIGEDADAAFRVVDHFAGGSGRRAGTGAWAEAAAGVHGCGTDSEMV